jgi:nitrous oxide reductase accessory protein NosL
MKKGLVLGALISLLMISFCWANEDISKNPSCKYCGMDRQKFAHSRMLVEYDDGTVVGTCSLHCLGVDLALNLDKAPKGLRVGDFNTKNLIDAEKAFWVIGGDKPGVMTKRAKWAFEKKEDAESFIKAHGGKSVAFDEAIKASYEDIYEDTRMIRERRKMMKKRSMEHKH